MQSVRYNGPDASRDLAISGAVLVFPRGVWRDPEELCVEAGVPVVHLEIVLRGLGPDWQFDRPKKVAAKKAAAKSTTTDPAPADEEKS